MEAPSITLVLGASAARSGWRSRLAGEWLWCDAPLGLADHPAAVPPGRRLVRQGDEALVYDGPGLVEGTIQRVHAFLAADGSRRVQFTDGESFLIAADGGRIERLAGGEGGVPPPTPATLERALGAPLALALAVRGVFVLHASALAGERGVIALAAPSGGGKSTLAAAARAVPEHRLTRVADDLLPVVLGAAPCARPHFPQLKLAAAEQYPLAAPADLPLAMVVEIARAPGRELAGGGAIHLEPLRGAAACLALARATVAARLFDPPLLAAHLAACAAAAGAVDVVRLHCPTDRGRLGESLAVLAARLRSGSR